MKVIIIVALLLAPAIATAQALYDWNPPHDLRIDSYDSSGKRTGYSIVNGATGRVDQFDARGNRTGYQTIDERGRVDSFNTRSERQGFATITGPRGNQTPPGTMNGNGYGSSSNGSPFRR